MGETTKRAQKNLQNTKLRLKEIDFPYFNNVSTNDKLAVPL